MNKKAKAQLIVLDQARRQLARVARVDEAKKIRDTAEALRTYAKQQSLGLEAQNKAAEIKIRAERRAGELLAAVERARVPGPGRGRKTIRQRDESFSGYMETLEDAGIAEPTARRWQRIAEIPEPAFEVFVATKKEAQQELTTAETLRYANEISEKPKTKDIESRIAKAPLVAATKALTFLDRVIAILKESDMSRLQDSDVKSLKKALSQIRRVIDRMEGKL